MPALKVFGRRWPIASDDFVIPEACDVIFRSTCFAIVGGYFWSNYVTGNVFCGGQFYINIYVYGSLFLTSLVICSSIALIFQSKSGSIVINSEHRKYVPTFIICRWILQITEIALNITGTIWVMQKKLTCTFGYDVFLTGLVFVSWVLIFFRILSFYLCFGPIVRFQFTTVRNNGEPNSKFVKKWQRKFLSLSFLLTGTPLLIKQALEETGYFFGLMLNDTDLVLSDIVAGVILLINRESKIQSKRRWKNNGNLKKENILGMSQENGKVNSVESDLNTLNSSLPALESWNSLPQIHHYLKYGMASFTWCIFLLKGRVPKIKYLWKKAILWCRKPKPSFHIEGDTNCYFHSAGLKAWQIEKMEIIYADYKNTIFEVPFFVSADHAKQAIVVSVRGTYSLNDIIVDLNGIPHQMGVPGLPESFKMHHGMLICTQIVKEKLDRLQLLPKLFATYPNYNLIFTGISLGAGVATGLGFMFKDAYPSLKCYSFSPPGCLLSADAVEYSKSFVISVVYGNDVFCRISLQSLEKAKYRIVEAISACRTPKYRIFLGAIYALCGGTPKFQYDENSSFYKTYKSQLYGNSEKDEDFNTKLNNEADNHADTFAAASNKITPVKKLQSFERMYPAGNLLHVKVTKNFWLGYDTKFKDKNPDYKGAPRWIIRWADKSEFTEIMLTSRLFLDHFPFRLNKFLKYLPGNKNSD